MKITRNNYVEQVCVVGSNLPQPIGLVVLSAEGRSKAKDYLKLSLAKTLDIINPELEKHERLHKLVILKDDWSIENGLLTPTLKIKRNPIEDKYQAFYATWYINPKRLFLRIEHLIRHIRLAFAMKDCGPSK